MRLPQSDLRNPQIPGRPECRWIAQVHRLSAIADDVVPLVAQISMVLEMALALVMAYDNYWCVAHVLVVLGS